MRVSAPGSSANLGAGFDALGLAVGLRLEVDDAPGPGETPADDGHPAVVAHRAAGGSGPLVVRSRIPAARGLGFSGAARVAGAFAARLTAGDEEDAARRAAYLVAAELEGHGDNAAASAYGGMVVAAGDHVVRVPLAVVPAVVVWVPSTTTSTKAARAGLPSEVPLADAAFNIGRAAMLIAALAAGDPAPLRVATEDRLHQDLRLAAVPESREAMCRLLDAGAWGAWLSGSGPTIAAFVDPRETERVAACLPAGGEARVLEVEQRGVARET
jgi:homoserine kinase